MDKFGAVICILYLCVKEEFKSVFYAVRYLLDSFVEKNVPFNRLVSKNYIKWYTLRNIATRSSLEDQPTRTESSSNYLIHLLILVVRLFENNQNTNNKNQSAQLRKYENLIEESLERITNKT